MKAGLVPNCSLVILWLVFTGLFFYMARREWRKSKQPLESLQTAFFKNPQTASGSMKLMGVDFEAFIRELERSNQESHQIAATGYFLAGLTALASFVLALLRLD